MSDGRLFAYDIQRPVTIDVLASEERNGARVDDIRYGPESVEAYLMAPLAGGSGPAILYCHWFDTESPIGNRRQFVDEAVAMAGLGAVGLLAQGTFPWSADPTDGPTDRARIEAEVVRLRRGLDLLTDRADVDPKRLAVVGHDFGGMYAALLAGVDRRPRAYALLVATPRWGDWFLPFWPIEGARLDYLRELEPVDPIRHVAQAAPASLLFQFARQDYYIAAMTGREFSSAASEPSEMRAYDSDHGLDSEEARADRRAFLGRELGLAATGR